MNTVLNRFKWFYFQLCHLYQSTTFWYQFIQK